MFSLLLIVLFNITICIPFVSRLYKVTTNIEGSMAFNLHDIMIKQTILCFVMVTSTVFCFTIWFLCGWGVVFHIDIFINTFMFMLSLGFNEKYYIKLCSCFQKCCAKIFMDQVLELESNSDVVSSKDAKTDSTMHNIEMASTTTTHSV
eukprot:UN05979